MAKFVNGVGYTCCSTLAQCNSSPQPPSPPTQSAPSPSYSIIKGVKFDLHSTVRGSSQTACSGAVLDAQVNKITSGSECAGPDQNGAYHKMTVDATGKVSLNVYQDAACSTSMGSIQNCECDKCCVGTLDSQAIHLRLTCSTSFTASASARSSASSTSKKSAGLATLVGLTFGALGFDTPAHSSRLMSRRTLIFLIGIAYLSSMIGTAASLPVEMSHNDLITQAKTTVKNYYDVHGTDLLVDDNFDHDAYVASGLGHIPTPGKLSYSRFFVVLPNFVLLLKSRFVSKRECFLQVVQMVEPTSTNSDTFTRTKAC